MKPWGKNLFSLVLAVLILLLASACQVERAETPREPPAAERPPVSAAPEPSPRPTRGEEPAVSRHAWDFLTDMDGEKEGFGMYTYVLFSRNVDRPGLASEVEERYKKILAAIAGTTLNLPELGELETREKKTTNILYIPAVAPGRELNLANYDSRLSLRYLSEIARLCREESPEISERLESRPGPFLISLLQPVGQIGEESVNLLYADLSTTNPAAMREVVAAYKGHLVRGSVDKKERFTSLRLTLLNLILNADDNVHLIKIALAGWVPQ